MLTCPFDPPSFSSQSLLLPTIQLSELLSLLPVQPHCHLTSAHTSLLKCIRGTHPELPSEKFNAISSFPPVLPRVAFDTITHHPCSVWLPECHTPHFFGVLVDLLEIVLYPSLVHSHTSLNFTLFHGTMLRPSLVCSFLIVKWQPPASCFMG